MKTDWQFLVVVYIFGVFLVVVIDSYAISMTKDIVVGDELPDWVGAKEFYQKFDPKEVIGRWVQQKKKKIWNVISVFFWDDKKNNTVFYINGISGVWAVWCAGVCTDTRARSWQWRLLRSQRRRWPLSSWRRWKPLRWRRSKSSTWWRDMPQSVCWTSAFFGLQDASIFFSWRFKSAETVSCFVPFSYSHWFIWVYNLHIFGVWPVSITTKSYIARVFIIPS